MNIAVHILCYNESEIVGYSLRHYATFATRIVLHDLGSTDGCQKIATDAGAEVVQWDCKGEFDDRLNKKIKNECWLGSTADWVVCVDADELIYFPGGAQATLEAYATQWVAVVNPYGYEMTSDEFPSRNGQIYDEVKHGARDDYWYGKKVLFTPRLVASVDFGTGAHVTTAFLKDGSRLLVDSKSPISSPSTYLLHFKHLGGLDRMTRLYAENQARQSAINKQFKWGNMEAPSKHAADKRRAILSRLERVLP